MIVEPKIRGFICTTAHPQGCAQHVQAQIDYIKKQGPLKDGPKKVLVIGASTGYGLASRIVAAIGGSAATIGVFFEKEAEGKRTATAGWYNSVAFEDKAHVIGLYAKSINGDAFSDEIKKRTIDLIKEDLGQLDLVIYSLASPRRVDPKTGKINKSSLKPIGSSYTNKSIDFGKNQLEEVSLPEATQEEIDQTVTVMGGEDWALWINALKKEKVLADNVLTVAYSYIGPEVTRDVYRNGTIGKAKEHLEATAISLNEQLKDITGRALISVNKALVTQSSSAIPFIPLYFILLKNVMKKKNIDEDCLGQIQRLFSTKLYNGADIPLDSNGFVRMDDFEMRDDVQIEVSRNWKMINNDNLSDYVDLEGYHKDFLKLFGFGVEGVNYQEDVEVGLRMPSLI